MGSRAHARLAAAAVLATAASAASCAGPGEVTIDLPAGTTVLTGPVPLPAGARTVHVRGNGRSTLSGALEIRDPRWREPDADLAARLPEEARPHVRMLGLPAAEFARWPGGLAGPVHAGHAVQVAAAPTEVFVAGQALVPARWPNAGWAAIERVVDAGSVPRNAEPDIPAAQRSEEPARGGTFVPADRTRLARWQAAEDAWMQGYWNWDWSDEQLPVAKVDPAVGTVTLAMPHRYGLAPRGRFFVSNVLEELDAPGECWIDRARGRLVAWLPEGAEREAVRISMLAEPMLMIPGGPDAPRVTVSGVAFECTRGPAIMGAGVAGATIDRCDFRNIGTCAVSLDGTGCTVARCSFAGIGGTGVSLAGGDRATLVPGGSTVMDSTFVRCSRLQRSYHPAIEIAGVGQRILRNEVSDLPHMAITYAGNEHLIEANHVHHVVLETGDAGAICTGRDWTSHGNVLRGNLVHDIPGTDERYQNAFYVDDMSSGITIESNLVVRCNWGMLVGGGRDDVVRDNAFVACGKAISYDARGVGWMAPHIADPQTSTLHRRLAAMPIDREPWRSRYPTLRAYLTDRFGRPVGGKVTGNALLATPLGRIDDRECVEESGTITLPAPPPAGLGETCDRLVREARFGTVTVGNASVGPVGPSSGDPRASGTPAATP